MCAAVDVCGCVHECARGCECGCVSVSMVVWLCVDVSVVKWLCVNVSVMCVCVSM